MDAVAVFQQCLPGRKCADAILLGKALGFFRIGTVDAGDYPLRTLDKGFHMHMGYRTVAENAGSNRMHRLTSLIRASQIVKGRDRIKSLGLICNRTDGLSVHAVFGIVAK